ncbi:Cyclin-dependent protein kinase [Modicella reniformis]|uniref:Cyclin-dependent protein kinase n=1 Tax=Modicella reniformis TaxID=1440133 RepID=A0A9P6M927_9FUNG|nr:Cyclin-dependent protein kinase [Modicella reniformis]
MITGRELSLFGRNIDTNQDPLHKDRDQQLQFQRDSQDHHQEQRQQQAKVDTLADNDEADIFYFIQRILKRTQLSCTTLILALIYIDRFKARLARTLKRRTRLDQGPDYNHIHHTNTTSLWPCFAENNRGMLIGSAVSSCFSSTSQSSSSTLSTRTLQSHGSGCSNCTSQSKPGQEPWSSISLFLVAVICADKYLFDATYYNAEWADFTKGQYTTLELNDLERRFLGHLQYKLYVSEPEFDGFLSYLEVILALKQVWGRGLITFSYSDVRILTQRLMPAYAGRLQFKTLQGDMLAIVWQVMATFSRVYLAIVGTIIVAAAGYPAMVELSRLVLDRTASYPTSSRGFGRPHDILPLSLTLFPIDTRPTQPLSCGYREQLIPLSSHQTLEHGPSNSQLYDEDPRYSIMNWAFAPSAVVQYVV